MSDPRVRMDEASRRFILPHWLADGVMVVGDVDAITGVFPAWRFWDEDEQGVMMVADESEYNQSAGHYGSLALGSRQNNVCGDVFSGRNSQSKPRQLAIPGSLCPARDAFESVIIF